MPWQVAVRSGDLQVLRDALPSMRRWVDWIASDLEAGLWLTDKQLGDWLDPDGPPEHPWAAKADRKLVANATFVHSARLLAQAMELCGEDGADVRGAREAHRGTAWERWGDEARTTQTGCALSLRFGLVPRGRARRGRRRRSPGWCAANGGRIGTGFLGTPEVLYALSDTGQLDAAYQLLTCRDCPSLALPGGPGRDDDVGAVGRDPARRQRARRPDGEQRRRDAELQPLRVRRGGRLDARRLAGLRVSELPTPELVIAPRPGGGRDLGRGVAADPPRSGLGPLGPRPTC